MLSKLAAVETNKIGKNVQMGEFCVISDGVTLGDNVTSHPNVIIESWVAIGDSVEIFPGTYIGKTPKGTGATSCPIEFIPQVTIGNNCVIDPNTVIDYDVVIGDDNLLGDGASLRGKARIGHHCLISRYVSVNYNTRTGNHTRVMDLPRITGDCEIGDNVFVGILVAATNDNSVFNGEYKNEKFTVPQIQNGAIIGSGASLLLGVTIKEGALVGSNAVVSRDVQPYDVVMGIPSKVTRNLKDRRQ
ncbi:MAG: transferase [Chloroflexi bacterium]|nr:transferase [Chloroflexota bacterium]